MTDQAAGEVIPVAEVMRVMIRCAQSGEGIPAGMQMSPAAFASSDLCEQRIKCPHCGQVHVWSAEDAWLEEIFTWKPERQA